MSKVIEVDDLFVKYGPSEVVANVSFAVESGDYVGLVGPNGSGKTTLIKAVLGLIPRTQGTVKLLGKKIEQFNNWRKIGYLPQKFSTINPLFPATAEEVVELGLLSQSGWPKSLTSHHRQLAATALADLGISDLKKQMFSELSGGQQQKVLLARALVSQPEILFFDEPSTALDPESREAFFGLIERLNRDQGITIVLITHDTGYIGKYANKLLYIDKSLVYYGKFSEFCRNEKMSSYFGDYQQHLICHQHD